MKSAKLKLDKIFSSFGIPLKIKSDTGSAFDCSNFDKYAKYLGFIHQPITPAYSQANHLVKNLNQIICKVLHTANIEHKKFEARTL